MLECLINYYTDGNKARFSAKIGIKPQTLSAWISRNSFDAETIYANCEGVSADWLLSGDGDMLKPQLAQHAEAGDGGVAIAAINNSGNVTMGDVAVMQEKIAMLQQLLDEKERLIGVLMKQ